MYAVTVNDAAGVMMLAYLGSAQDIVRRCHQHLEPASLHDLQGGAVAQLLKGIQGYKFDYARKEFLTTLRRRVENCSSVKLFRIIVNSRWKLIHSIWDMETILTKKLACVMGHASRIFGGEYAAYYALRNKWISIAHENNLCFRCGHPFAGGHRCNARTAPTRQYLSAIDVNNDIRPGEMDHSCFAHFVTDDAIERLEEIDKQTGAVTNILTAPVPPPPPPLPPFMWHPQLTVKVLHAKRELAKAQKKTKRSVQLRKDDEARMKALITGIPKYIFSEYRRLDKTIKTITKVNRDDKYKRKHQRHHLLRQLTLTLTDACDSPSQGTARALIKSYEIYRAHVPLRK